MSDGQTKQFGKSQRVVPADKAQKWYPVDDQSQPKKVSTPYENGTPQKRGGHTTGTHLPPMIATIAPVFCGRAFVNYGATSSQTPVSIDDT